MNHSIRFGIIAVLVLAQIGLGGAFAYNHVADSRSNIPDAPQRGAPAPADEAGMRKAALTQARLWRTDAKLIDEVSWLSWPTTAPDPNQKSTPVNGWATFVFATGGERLAIVIDRGSGFVLGQHPKELGLDTFAALDPAATAVTAETAVLVVELLGGRDYRAACPAHRNLTKVGVALDPSHGATSWVVTYADDRHSSLPDIIVKVNATSGAVEQQTINQPPCDAS
jgi:hypothetical protein